MALRLLLGSAWPRPDQLEDNLAATELKLSPEQLAVLDAASALPAEYPGWMVQFQNSRDPRGTAQAPTEEQIRAAAQRLR
jgi:hypothetical protein